MEIVKSSKITVVKEVEEDVVEYQSIVCNKCGKETEVVDDFSGSKYQSFGCSFGYGSIHDMEYWNFDLCEDCLVEFIKTFKHVPDGFMEDRDYLIIKNREEHQKIFDDWKETDTWEDLKFKTYDELVEFSGIFNAEYINEVIKQYHPDKPLLEEIDEE